MKIKKAFTLIELIIVIAIIIILATITVVVINPVSSFQNARNATRNNDLQNINSAISRYLADSSITSPSRSLADFSGYSSLLAGSTIVNQLATPGYEYRCNNGVNKLNLPAKNDLPNGYYHAYSIDSLRGLTVNLNVLLNNAYLTKVPKDPLDGSPYQACIDTTNNNQMVLYAPMTEGTSGTIVSSLITPPVTIYAWDSFARNTTGTLGNIDKVNASLATTPWTTSGGTFNIYSSNDRIDGQVNSGIALIDIVQNNGRASIIIRNNIAGSFGVVFRAVDSSNYWFLGTNGSSAVTLNKIVAGSTSSITSLITTGIIPDFSLYRFTPNPLGSPNLLEVTLNGSTIIASFNGTSFQQATDPTFSTATKFGAWSNSNNLFSDFIMTSN